MALFSFGRKLKHILRDINRILPNELRHEINVVIRINDLNEIMLRHKNLQLEKEPEEGISTVRFSEQQGYAAVIDAQLKRISVPLKIILRREKRLFRLFQELKAYLQDPKNQRDLRNYGKDKLARFQNSAKFKLEEFQLINTIIGLVDKQREFTRIARQGISDQHSRVFWEHITSIKKATGKILAAENIRIHKMAEYESYLAGKGGKFETRVKAAAYLRKIFAAAVATYLLFGIGLSFTLATTSIHPRTFQQEYSEKMLSEIEYEKAIPNIKVKIPGYTGPISSTLYKMNNGQKIVLLLHPLTHNQTMYIPTLREILGKGYNALTFDFIGHGRSRDKVFGTVTYGINESEQVLDVMKYLENQGYKEIVLIGQSMGAVAAVRAAARYDGRMQIKGIAVEGLYADAYNTFVKVGWTHFRQIPTHLIGAELGGIISGVKWSDLNTAEDIKQVGHKKIPILYQWGTEDNAVPFSDFETLPKQTAGPKKVEIHEGGLHIEPQNAYRIGLVLKFTANHM